MQIGAILVAFLTGILLEWGVGWRWLFVLYALPGGIWALLFYRWFRDRPQDHASVTKSELNLLLAESKAAQEPEAAAKEGSGRSRPVKTPWKHLAASPAMWAICGQQYFRAAGYIFYASWFPTYLQESRGVSVAESGTADECSSDCDSVRRTAGRHHLRLDLLQKRKSRAGPEGYGLELPADRRPPHGGGMSGPEPVACRLSHRNRWLLLRFLQSHRQFPDHCHGRKKTWRRSSAP